MDKVTVLEFLNTLKVDARTEFSSFDNRHRARLDQLDGHIDTVKMLVEHLFDERERG